MKFSTVSYNNKLRVSKWKILTVCYTYLQIIADILSPFFLIFLYLRTKYYPLKDTFGEYFCHFFNYLLPIGAFAGQFHSFFLTSFRYICLFHDDFLIKYNISPKVSTVVYLITPTRQKINTIFL